MSLHQQHSSVSKPLSREQQYMALTREAGFRQTDEHIVVEVTGDDRVSFLQGLCSNDVKSIAAGEARLSLLLTEHAHVISDFFLISEANRILIDIDRELWPRSLEHMNRFLVADDVEFRELDDVVAIQIAGPKATRAVENLNRGEISIGKLGDAEVRIFPSRSALPQFLAGLAIPQVEAEIFETVRIEQGRPKIGQDTGEKTIALEARLEPAISFTKGCYLGQETIERATARGALKKRLFGIRLQTSKTPEMNSPVMLDGKEVGRVTSATISPRLGAIALAILHHSAWNAGTAVQVLEGSEQIEGKVSDLPFTEA